MLVNVYMKIEHNKELKGENSNERIQMREAAVVFTIFSIIASLLAALTSAVKLYFLYWNRMEDFKWYCKSWNRISEYNQKMCISYYWLG